MAENAPPAALPPFVQPTAAEMVQAARIVDSQPVVSAFASCEWACLDEDGQVWIAAIVREAGRTRQHDYWGAGEADCPRDIKAPNGELFKLRCRTCGLDNPRDPNCRPELTEARNPA